MFHICMLLQDGNTSLHLASWEGHGEECDLLLGDKPEKVREANYGSGQSCVRSLVQDVTG